MSDEEVTRPDGARLTPVPPEPTPSKLPGYREPMELIAQRLEFLPNIYAIVNETLVALQEIKVHDAAKFEKIESDLRSLCESVKELKRDNAADLARFSDLEKRIKVLEDRIQALELLTNQ